MLETFLETEFSSENLLFWIAVQDLKYSADSEIEKKVEYLYKLVHFLARKYFLNN